MIELSGTLIIDEGKLLLLYRKDEDYWEVPGGKVEEDESPTEAAVREVREEIGVEARLKKPFYSGEFQHDGEMFLWHGYIADILEGKPEVRENKFKKLEWFNGSELEDVDLAPNIRMILPSLRNLLD